MEISGNPYTRNQKSRPSNPETPFKREKSRTLKFFTPRIQRWSYLRAGIFDSSPRAPDTMPFFGLTINKYKRRTRSNNNLFSTVRSENDFKFWYKLLTQQFLAVFTCFYQYSKSFSDLIVENDLGKLYMDEKHMKRPFTSSKNKFFGYFFWL